MQQRGVPYLTWLLGVTHSETVRQIRGHYLFFCTGLLRHFVARARAKYPCLVIFETGFRDDHINAKSRCLSHPNHCVRLIRYYVFFSVNLLSLSIIYLGKGKENAAD
jgi:hypothetical protein